MMDQLRQEYIRLLSAYLASPDEAHLFEAQSFGIRCAEQELTLAALLNMHFKALETGEVILSDETLLAAQKFLLQTALVISIRNGAEATIENILAALYDETVIRFEKELFELNTAKERFRTLVQTIPDIVYLVDKDGVFRYLNDAVESLGYKPAELIGEHFGKIIQPADLEAVSRSSVLQRFSGLTTGEKDSPKLFDERRTGVRKTVGLEVRLALKNQEIRPAFIEMLGESEIIAEVNSSGLFIAETAIPDGAEPRSTETVKVFFGTVGVIRDITARKRLEVELTTHRDHLESLVGERTAELLTANQELHKEIAVRTQIEEALRESEERYRSVVDNIAVGVALISPAMEILALNNQMKRWFPQVDPAQKPVCYKAFHTPPSAAACSYCPSRKTLVDGQVHEAISATPTGETIRHFRIVSSAIKDMEGKVIAAIELVEDISERKKTEDERKVATEALQKSEAFNRDILQSVGEGFIVIDADYKIVSANKAYCEQVKMPLQDIIGQHCYKVSHHIDKPCFMEDEECAPWHTFRTGEPHAALHTHYDKDGEPIYIETKSFPMQDATGTMYAVIETLNNITEKRTLEEQLRHTQKMEAIGTLASGIAHDFNNMLSVILGYGGIVQMKIGPDDPLYGDLKQMLSAGSRAAQLTASLLAFSRKQVMEIRTVNLNEIIDGFKKMLTRIIGEDIELLILPAKQDLIIKADIVQIEQVLMNLAANARDAMPKGGSLTIETTPLSIDKKFIRTHGYGEPGMYALITVADTGTGMDEKTRARIFEPYYTTKELGKGSGLGLSIVYGIVKQHKGYINCSSEPGKGTTFKIYLPLVLTGAEKTAEAEVQIPQGGNETILVAEDDANVREFMKDLLQGNGYQVIEAVDGLDAVLQFREHQANIDLLLFDLIMPKKNGKDAFEDIQVIRPGMKAIFTSGYAADIIQRFGIEEDIAFIAKPVSPIELLLKVREALDK